VAVRRLRLLWQSLIQVAILIQASARVAKACQRVCSTLISELKLSPTAWA
jgi:hypothetical protein